MDLGLGVDAGWVVGVSSSGGTVTQTRREQPYRRRYCRNRGNGDETTEHTMARARRRRRDQAEARRRLP